MEEEIIESVKNCKLVRTGYTDNGHDCGGNYEYSSYKYVIIDGKEEKCWDDWLVIHDGKNVKELCLQSTLDLRLWRKAQDIIIKEHFEKTGFNTPAEYAAYLKGKAEKDS